MSRYYSLKLSVLYKTVALTCIFILYSIVSISQEAVNRSIADFALHSFNSLLLSSAEAKGREPAEISDLEVVYSSPDSSANTLVSFSISNGGFIWVLKSGSNLLVPAYSVTGDYTSEWMSPGLRSFISAYESVTINKAVQGREEPSKGSVDPMLETESIRWNQTGFYNEACPFDASEGRNTLAGCVAVAMAQIMRYHKHPATGVGSHSYQHQVYGTISADFGSTSYNWNNMPGSVWNSEPEVARLLFHAGVSVEMSYTPYSSSAATAKVAPAFRNHFRYPDALQISRNEFGGDFYSDYYVTMREELDAGRPFFFVLNGPQPHAAVIDGYNNEGYFHINFGWGGSDNGYFALTGSFFAGGYQFGINGDAIIQISPAPVNANVQDSLALVALYNSTGGSSWVNKTNWLTGELHTWYGITVIGGRVRNLVMSGNNLSGQLPSELGNLTALRNINLSGNSISGTIPSSLGNLVNLSDLILSFNNLSGNIPPTLWNLVNLRRLSLGYNELEGTLPAESGNLASLEYLHLQSNNLTGNLPASLGNLLNLKSFDVSGNSFSGELPATLGNLSRLTDFIVSRNTFSGNIPESVSSWTSLNMFSIEDNQFEGILPVGIGSFTGLIILNLDNNRLTGLGEGIGQLTNLQRLTAVNNRIEGPLPAQAGNMVHLKYLDLSGNNISAIPPQFGNLRKLEYLNLNSNDIEELPAEIGNLESLTEFSMAGNKLESLPYETGNLLNLLSLNVSGNNLKEINFGISLLRRISVMDFSGNRIASPMPPLSHLLITDLRVNNNAMTFEDIAASLLPDNPPVYNNYLFYYRYQDKVKPAADTIFFTAGDSVGIDIRSLTRFRHPENIYEWYRNGTQIATGPVLSFPEAGEAIAGAYHCSVTNGKYTLLTIETEPLYLVSATTSTTGSDTLITRSGSPLLVADERVSLVVPAGVRGTLTWQSSLDTINWVNLSGNITNPDISANIRAVYNDSVIVEPVSKALYRYMVTEGSCDPLFSDTLVILPYRSHLLIDTLLNVGSDGAVVRLDSIEITLPEGLATGDFRLTIRLVETPPAFPDSVRGGAVFDVRLSCGTQFPVPLTISLRVNSDSLKPEYHNRFMAVWYDDARGIWLPFDNSTISEQDSSVVFNTTHLTKLTWWERQATGNDFTDKFTRDGVTVYFKQKFLYMMDLYDKNQSEQEWHLKPADPEYGIPLMVQDAARFTREVMDKFKMLGLQTPEEIAIYLDNIDDYGVVGLMGMINGYLTVSLYIDDPILLRSVIAHEYMHYTQDYYISAHAGNIFWMEANGHLADRMVWDSLKIPVSESDRYLIDGRSGENNIFSFLSRSWDYWDASLLTQNLTGNVHQCYLAGTFIHYMRSYRDGTKLKPEKLLSETSLTGSWKSYLNSYIVNNLTSDIGTEYEKFVRYIISGINPAFTVLNNETGASGDPLRYLNSAPGEFLTRHLFKIPDEATTIEPQFETINLEMPGLSARMEHIYNLSTNRALCVSYKRLHSDTSSVRVLLGKWNDQLQTIDFEDIAQIDSSFFFIEAATSENVSVKSNQAFILFINKSHDETLTAGYDLEILPVADFDYLFNLDFYYDMVFDAPIHNFSDGISRRILLAFTATEFSKTKVYSDSSFTTTVSSDGLTQTVWYNFRTGDLVISEIRSTGGPLFFDPDGYVYFTENTAIEMRLKDIFLVPFSSSYVSQGAGVYYKQTASTAETISKITGITCTVTTKLDHESGGSQNISYHYTGTDWGVSNNIRLNMQFK